MRGPLPTLRTERLTIRPFSRDDAVVVQRLAGAREVASTTMNVPHPYEDGVAERWIESHAAGWEADKLLSLAITTAQDGVVGCVSLRLSLLHRRAELGYWVGVPYWNRGYATEAARALVRYGFEDLGLNRIVARFFRRNPSSGRVIQKLGMSHEGIQRQHIVKWDEPEDLEVYAILKADWKELDA